MQNADELNQRNADIIKYGKVVLELETERDYDDWIEDEDEDDWLDLSNIPVVCKSRKHKGRSARMIEVSIEGIPVGAICLKCLRFSPDIDTDTIRTLTGIKRRKRKHKQQPFSCYR